MYEFSSINFHFSFKSSLCCRCRRRCYWFACRLDLSKFDMHRLFAVETYYMTLDASILFDFSFTLVAGQNLIVHVFECNFGRCSVLFSYKMKILHGTFHGLHFDDTGLLNVVVFVFDAMDEIFDSSRLDKAIGLICVCSMLFQDHQRYFICFVFSLKLF